MELQALLTEIVKGIVKNPDDVSIEESQDSDEQGEIIVLNIKVAREDVGICIGKGGDTAEAIRKIIGLIGFRNDERVYVKIDAPKIPRANHRY